MGKEQWWNGEQHGKTWSSATMSTSVCIIANRRIITEISDKQQQFLSISVLATPKFQHEPLRFPSLSSLSLISTPIFLSHKLNSADAGGRAI